MLFYNAKKEFVGIDEEGLRSLGFSNLSELMSESADFADLFVRTPGFIHNFKYVHWIDYIMYGGSSDIPKAIIHTKARNYWCNIDITTLYMADAPASKAYMIHLVNLRELSQKEIDEITVDIEAKPAPYSNEIEEAPFIHPSVKENIKKSIEKQNQSYTTQVQDTSVAPQKVKKVTASVQKKSQIDQKVEPEEDVALEIEEDLFSQRVEVEEPISVEDVSPEVAEVKDMEEVLEEVEVHESSNEAEGDLGFNINYIFDPQVASDELGLPIDLIEEFVEDFIVQAKEFKDDLYNYVNEEDINNVRILSHKLKGVAANLRVEDAFDVLVIINTADDLKVIRKHLDYLYGIIAKLNGEAPIAIVPQEEPIEDELVLAFKDFDDEKEEQPKEVSLVQEKESSPDTLLELVDDNKVEEVELDVNFDKISAALELNMELSNYEELLSDYLVDSKELCNSIIQVVEFNEEDAWKQKTTQLKGMSESMKTYNLISNEIDSLLETSQQSVAKSAIKTITQIISNIKV